MVEAKKLVGDFLVTTGQGIAKAGLRISKAGETVMESGRKIRSCTEHRENIVGLHSYYRR